MHFDNWSESFQVTDRGRTSELETETHIKVEYEGMSFNSCPLIQLYADDKWGLHCIFAQHAGVEIHSTEVVYGVFFAGNGNGYSADVQPDYASKCSNITFS